jgi:4-alpha-glucanotransferase
MDSLDQREWLLTNGLGSFASGTVADARTRKYHGWLVAALSPPSQRTLLLSHLETRLERYEKTTKLGTNFWQDGAIAPQGYKLLSSFNLDPIPIWIWQQNEWQLTRKLVMPYGLEGQKGWCHRILGQYYYEGREPITLKLCPLIADRNFHAEQTGVPELEFRQQPRPQSVIFQARTPIWEGTPWQLRWSGGNYTPTGEWYWNYSYPIEKYRGLRDREDLYNPGCLTVELQPGERVTLEARVDTQELPSLQNDDFDKAQQQEEKRLNQIFHSIPTQDQTLKKLRRAGEQFIVYRASTSSPSIIAGYPWFSDWGRDTLISIPGLALATKRYDLAKGLLATFGHYCRNGIIPNTFPDEEGEPIYNSIDASLWWIEALGLYLEATQDWDFLAQQYGVAQQIYQGFSQGTDYGIHVDPTDGLVTWDSPDVALTWMDAVLENQVMTARQGKNIEINALWYSALCSLSQWEKDTKHAQLLQQQAQKVQQSLKKFWNPDLGYFHDRIEPDGTIFAQVRPNAVIALALHHCPFETEQGQKTLKVAKERLLTPYGLRSLDPADPEYIRIYEGDREQRDRAYHQGTVWSWLIGPFVRAWQRFYPDDPIPFDWQPLLHHLMNQGCIGSVSEIFDGDTPQAPKGAYAQAWSVAEMIRCYEVWKED